MIFDLGEKYRLGSPHISRALGYSNAAINDTFVITWFLKYLWDVADQINTGEICLPC